MGNRLLSALGILLALTISNGGAQAQGLLPPTTEACADIIEPTMKKDCQEVYELRQVFQNRIEDIRTVYQLAELVQPATVWIVPGYGEPLTFEPPARVIVLQQFTLADTGEPWIQVRFTSGKYGFIQTAVVE